MKLLILQFRLKFSYKLKLEVISGNATLIKPLPDYIKRKILNNKLVALIRKIANIDIVFIFLNNYLKPEYFTKSSNKRICVKEIRLYAKILQNTILFK